MDFDKLWKAYPNDHDPCRAADGTPNFPNQCAIRLGLALIDGGVDLSRFSGAGCWFGHGGKHVLRGEELSDWMRKHPAIFGRCEIRTGVDESVYQGRRGIIFCRNFWGPGNQGDHMDLWNRSYMKTGNPGYISRSSEVWFWEIDSTTLRAGKKRRRRSKDVKTPKK